MDQILDRVLDTLEPFVSAPALHAISVHMPIALAMLGVPLVYAAAAIAASGNTLRWTAFVAYLGLAGAAAFSVETGEGASAKVPGSAPGAIWDTISQHSEMAEQVWIFALVTAACMLISTVKVGWLRKLGITLAMVASLATAGWVGFVGHLGGQLVYESGIGSPYHPILYRDSPGGPVLEGVTNVSSRPAAVLEDEEDELIPIRDIDMNAAMAVSYEHDVLPLIEKHCIECHTMFEAKGELVMETIEDMLIGGEKDGPSIVPGKPDESPLVLYTRGILKPQMPKGEEPLTEDELHTLRLWIAAGATDDDSASPALAPAAPSPAAQESGNMPSGRELKRKQWLESPLLEGMDPDEALRWLNRSPE